MSAELLSKIKKGSIGTLLLKAGYISLSFILSIFLARFLGAEKYGEYSVLMSIVAVSTVILQYGFPTLLVKRISLTASENEAKKNISNVVFHSLQFLFITSLTISFFSLSLAEFFEIENEDNYLWTLLLIIVVSFSSYRNAILRGLNRIILGQLPDEIGKPVLFLGLVYLLVKVFHIDLTVTTTLQLNIIASSIVMISGYVFLFLKIMSPKFIKVDEFNEPIFREALPFFMFSLLLVVQQNVDIIMISELMDMKKVGVYKIANMSANLLGLMLMAISMAIMPNISKLYKEKKLRVLRDIVVKGHRSAFILSLPLTILFILFGEIYLIHVFGTEYREGYTVLVIMILGKLFYSGVGLIGMIFNMMGMSWYVTINAALIVILNIVLNYFSIPVFGLEGAALSTIFSQLCANIILVVVFYRKFKFDLSLFGFHKIQVRRV